MLALESHLKARLAALSALTGWAVRTGTEASERRAVPAADVRCTGARTTDSETTAVTLDPAWTVTLVVPRSDQAAGQLDAALNAVIGSLHNWHPGQLSGRVWRRLALQTVREPEFTAEGQAGLELVFATSTVYHGQVLTR
ncbi:hypothetical protein [Polaromonas glacialis]|uniref:hypothetical protein n=1 Tax=Polaromonas glacialis TaxID=866564 RepID=UPI000495D808|nr:hypothetical protein [Polaromonas glacialis]